MSLRMAEHPKEVCCTASRNGLDASATLDGATGSAVTANRGPATPRAVYTFSRAAAAVDHEFVRLENADFLMGGADRDAYPGDGEGPPRRVRCSPYGIATRAVSNAQFARFVAQTGYVTDAERFGWSYVFHLLLPEPQRRGLASPAGLPWWLQVMGACWAAPEGRGSQTDERMDHPVTHVSWFDAQAYCYWAHTRLPTEAEWEYAARGGLERKRYAWGDTLRPLGEHRCNIWQGTFPHHNTAADGYAGSAPVDAYQPNGHGLYNVCGNVWEWCADWYTPNYHRVTRGQNPIYLVPRAGRSIRGGSFICHRSWCNRYRLAARSSISPDTSTSHCGFRVVAL